MIIIRRVIDCILVLLVLGASLLFVDNITNSSITGYGIFSSFNPLNFVSPGGCKGDKECQAYCETNPEECIKWCKENPVPCNKIGGVGPSQIYNITEPPNSHINYVKTVNLNAGQFTGDDIIKAKSLGANVVTYWPGVVIQNDEFLPFEESSATKIIDIAHKNGLQIEMRGSYGGESIKNYQKFRDNAIKQAVQWGRFAEKNKAYGVIPFGEIDNTLLKHCDKITSFAKEILTETRKYYSGKIGIGIAAPWRDCGFTFKGYDYLTVSAYPQAQIGIDKWLIPNPSSSRNIDNNNLALIIKWARDVADRSNITTIRIGETGIVNPDDRKREDYKAFAVGSKEKETEYFTELFNQIADDVDGISVFYNSKFNYMSVNGDQAEKIVREFFYKKGRTNTSNLPNSNVSMQKSDDSTSNFLLSVQCKQKLWPPSCDTITKNTEKKLCLACKEYLESESQPIQSEPTKISSEKKKTLLVKITDIFRKLFAKE